MAVVCLINWGIRNDLLIRPLAVNGDLRPSMRAPAVEPPRQSIIVAGIVILILLGGTGLRLRNIH